MPHRTAFTRALLAGGLVWLVPLLGGCGDDDGPTGGGGDGGRFRPAADTVLGGTRQFSDVSIPAGVTVAVREPLTLRVSRNLRLAGRLLGECVPIEIEVGGDADFSGEIANVCGELADGSRAPSLTVSTGGTLRFDILTMRASGDVTLSNDPRNPAGLEAAIGSRALKGSQEEVSCLLRDFLFKPTPETAAAGEASENAGDGIEGGTWTFACGGRLIVDDTRVAAQDGGAGGEAEARSAAQAVASGGAGGLGGTVLLSANGPIEFSGVNVLEAGDGGVGGSAIAVGDSASGASSDGTGGDGGDGGRVEIRPGGTLSVAGPFTIRLAAGGDGGAAEATGADGGDASEESLAVDGGNATALAGHGGRVPSAALPHGSIDGEELLRILGAKAGNGGTATAIGGKGGDGILSFPDAGDGGNVRAVGGAGGDVSDDGDAEVAVPGSPGSGGIVALLGGAGGAGGSGCVLPDQGTNGPGGDGGSGGDASGEDGRAGAGGEEPAGGGGAILSALGNGGIGGGGEPPGQGGEPGNDGVLVHGERTEVGLVFQAGIAGEVCPPVERTPVRAKIGLERGSDPAGHDPGIFNVTAVQTPNPNQVPTGSVDIGLTVFTFADQIVVEGPEPWVRVQGELAANNTFVATGTGTVKGIPDSRVELRGLWINRGLSAEYEMTPSGQPSITYTVLSPQR